MNQNETAKNEMVRWLSHVNELGKVPAKIEITNNFDYKYIKWFMRCWK